jgi:hypothetical protein
VQLSDRVIVYSAPDVEAWLQSKRVDPSRATA